VTKPTAIGNLAQTPFCELLVYALGRSLSGSLVLECPDRSKHALLFQLGAPVKARADVAELRLGALLEARGVIDAAARVTAEAGASPELFGERLVAAGALSGEQLGRILDEQLYDQIAWLARVPSATAFAYFADIDLLAQWGGEHRKLDPLAVIWHAIQSNPPKERIALACQGLGDKVLRLHPASRIGRFGLGARERPVLDVLRMKPQTLTELAGTALLERDALERLLYGLTLTRHLDTGEMPLGVTGQTRQVPAQRAPRRPASSAAQPAAPAAAALAADQGEAPKDERALRRELSQTGRFASREEIEAKHRQLEQLDYYAVLDLERNASAEQIAAAFTALVRRWHPDRLSPELADLKEVSMRVFARMTEAHRTLAQPASRADYDRSLGIGIETGDSEQAQIERVLRAAESFQKAEILLRKRDFEGAERLAALAVAGDKDQPEYAALFAWIRARKAGASEQDIAASLDVLKGAVAKQTNNVKVRYYYAGVLKLSGHDNAALREFKFVADNDPSNLDAARELRLAEMRRHGGQGGQENAPGEGGLFGRFFKRQ
jgi:curved DNA-binding protein CbpA